MINRSIVVLIFITMTIALSGCLGVPQGSENLRIQSRNFISPSGKANIYVIRSYNFIGSGELHYVSIDFQEFGILEMNSYLYGFIDPGTHYLDASSPKVKKINVISGKNYFFKTVRTFINVKIKEINENEGRDLVMKYKLSGNNMFEYKIYR